VAQWALNDLDAIFHEEAQGLTDPSRQAASEL